jgi:hypothetical protein
MSDAVLKDFLKARGLIKEPEIKKKVEKIPETIPILDNNLSLNYIINEKPSRKKIIEFLKYKMEAHEKEFLDI